MAQDREAVMAQKQRVSFELASYIGLRIHRANETAALQFAKVSGDAVTVTIPSRQLARLYGDIDRKLLKAPELDVRASKKA
jgi:hypothetical protein